MSTPTAKHWSGVDAGEPFTIELDYDGEVYKQASVKLHLRRNATSGFTESAVPHWVWSVQSLHGEGMKKVANAAKASGFFTPPLLQSGTSYKQTGVGSFFAIKPGPTPPPPKTPSSSTARLSRTPGSRSTPIPCSLEEASQANEMRQASAAAVAAALPPAKRPCTPAEAMKHALVEAGLGPEAASRIRYCPGSQLTLPAN